MNTRLIYDTELLHTAQPKIYLNVYDVAYDLIDIHNQAEDSLYHCELIAKWDGVFTAEQMIVSTRGLIGNTIDTFEIDSRGNDFMYDYTHVQDNDQGFWFSCGVPYDNHEAISQAAADRLAEIANNLDAYIVHIDYPNGR